MQTADWRKLQTAGCIAGPGTSQRPSQLTSLQLANRREPNEASWVPWSLLDGAGAVERGSRSSGYHRTTLFIGPSPPRSETDLPEGAVDKRPPAGASLILGLPEGSLQSSPSLIYQMQPAAVATHRDNILIRHLVSRSRTWPKFQGPWRTGEGRSWCSWCCWWTGYIEE